MVLSARSGSHEKVVALDLVAVDYIAKPFDTSGSRCPDQSNRRRVTVRRAPRVVSFGDVTVDLVPVSTVTRMEGDGTKIVHLTATE